MSKFGAFATGLNAGANLGTQILNNDINAERQSWARYAQEKEVEGDKLNALMNVATSQYGGDITRMAESPAGLNMMFDLMKDDPQIKSQLESNSGWTPAGMFKDKETGKYGFVVTNEAGERKPLTVDRASGSASFTMSQDDLLRTFAASAGRTGQKDTLSMNRALNIINNMEGVDKEEAKALLTGGTGGVDIPTAPSIVNVSKAARDARASRDENQTGYNTSNSPVLDPKSGAKAATIVTAPKLGDVSQNTEVSSDVSLAEAGLEAVLGSPLSQKKDAAISAVQDAVASGLVSEDDANSVLEAYNKGGLSARQLEAELRSKASPDNLTRNDGTQKGSGYLGVLKNSNGDDVTEYAVGVNLDGKEVEIPTLVPTLTEAEVQAVLDASAGNGDIPESVMAKAVEFAKQRIANGESPFKVSGDMSTRQVPKLGYLNPQEEAIKSGMSEPAEALREDVPPSQDRTLALNRLTSGQATNSDLIVEEQGVSPSYSGQNFPAGSPPVAAPTPTRPRLGVVADISGVTTARQLQSLPQKGTGLGRVLGDAVSKLPAVAAAKTIYDSVPEGAADKYKAESYTDLIESAKSGDTKGFAKALGSQVKDAATLATGFVDNLKVAASEKWDTVAGATADLFSGFSEGFDPEKAKVAGIVIDDKVKQVAEQAQAPEKAKSEAANGRITTQTANDPEKLATTANVIKQQTASLTAGERVLYDTKLLERAFAPSAKPTAKQKYAATYLLTSGMISEPAYRNYMTTGEWSSADRELALSELTYRQNYVTNQIQLKRLENSGGADYAKAAKNSFEDAAKRSSPIVATAVMNSKSLAGGQELSGEKLNSYSSLLLDSYLDNSLLLGRLGVRSKYELSPEQVNFVAENIATGISNGSIVYQNPSKADDSSLFSTNYWFGSDKEGINPLSQRNIAQTVQGWFESTK